MVHFVTQYPQVLVSPDGHEYVARVYASTHALAGWDAWFVFFPLRGGRELATDRQTTQGSLAAVSYWASGITTTYLEAALERARALLPEARLARRAQHEEREEELARAEAEIYARSAAVARLEAREAARRRREAEALLLAERARAARLEADLHERAAAAARAEAAEAEGRRGRRHGERRFSGERRQAPAAVAHEWSTRRRKSKRPGSSKRRKRA